MTEPDSLPPTFPSTAPDTTEEVPILVASARPARPAGPAGPDRRYGYLLPGRRAAQVVVISVVLTILGILAALLPQLEAGVVPICLSMVPLFAVALLAAAPLAAAGEEDAPVGPLLAGWAVILGGAACDIYATVSHSPDLAQEANPVIRGLLDNGLSLELVYLFAAISQVLFVGLTMVLWRGLLKHRHTLVATMPPHGSLLAYLKAGTGGRELSYRQWLCPLTFSELPWAYHFAWWIGVSFVAASAYRFYLALEWYRVVPVYPLWVRFIAPAVVFFLACRWYAAWLRRARQRLGDDAPEL
jgi:hypothetical protein